MATQVTERGRGSGSTDFDRVVEWALTHLPELVHEYGGVELTDGGRGPCPVHGGTNLNFSVTPGRGWYCHSGCAGGGDGVDFVRRMQFSALSESEGRLSALRLLAPRAGVELNAARNDQGIPSPFPRHYEGKPKGTRSPSRVRDTPDPTEALRLDGFIPQGSSALYQVLSDTLKLGERGAGYLAARGLDAAAARRFGFRSLDSGSEWVAIDQVLAESFTTEERASAGLDRAPWRMAPAYGHWHTQPPALLIPYYDLAGELAAVRFRAMDSTSPKYVTLGGTTPTVPFNVRAIDGAAGAELHIVEGEINAYTLHTHGLRAIGLPGAGMWAKQWTQLLAPVERVVAWYDDDAAGERGRSKLATTLAASMGERWVRLHGRAMVTPEDANDLHTHGTLHGRIERAAWRD